MNRLIFSTIFSLFGSTLNAETCFLQIQGMIHMEGECSFESIDETGGFYAQDLENGVFVYFGLDENGVANAFWNNYESRAHDPLGLLERAGNGGCWQNSNVTLCAWR